MIKPLTAGGCKKKVAATDAPPPIRAATDAGPGPDEAEGAGPDEATLRAGKRTGLGGPDEAPEVATEDLAQALIGGATPWRRVLSPTAGVVELRAGGAPTAATVTRHCGPDVDRALAALGVAMTTRLAQPDLGYELGCDNRGLGGAPPSALCSIDGASADAVGYDLVFVPDPTLGLRLVGFTILDGGDVPDPTMDAFDLELAKTGPRCP